MQAVILAAGRGTRMRHLTENTPKPLLEVAGRPLIRYTLDALPDEIEEVVIVVGYLGHMIQEKIGGDYFGKKILYAEQSPQHGTGGALWSAKEILKEKFIVVMGDDLYAREDIARATKEKQWGIGVQKVSALDEGGRIIADANGHITEIVEGKHHGGAGLISTNLFALDTRIFSEPLVPKAHDSEEFGLPQTALAATHTLKIPFEAMHATSWIQISSPEDLKKAEEMLNV